MRTEIYPESPGWKTDATETSRAAALAVKPDAATLRAKCYDVLKVSAQTADEVAEILGLSVLSVRPRISELNKQFKIEATKFRRKNASGNSAVVWCVPGTLAQGDLL